MKEGSLSHEEVNAAIAAAPKTLLFGSQNRARQGLQVGDAPLRPVHVAHDQVRFFYSALRQLPEFLFEALLQSNITVTLVMDCDLLAFRDVRNHQAIHIGLARRTIYLPEGLLAAVHQNGYDYWSLAQILIVEGWKLLDYALLVTLVEAGLRRQFTHLTAMGHGTFRHVLREHNRHRSSYRSPARLELQRRSGLPLPINELEEFIQLYEEPFRRLLRPSYKGTPTTADQLAHRLYDDYHEELWAHRKFAELAEEHQFPTVFLLDRDVVHPVARQRAALAGQDLSPQDMAEARHDFADELRFGHHRDGAVERLVRAALRFGAEGVAGLLCEICATLCTAGRIDEDLEERIGRLLAVRTSHPVDLQVNLRHGVTLARCAAVLRFHTSVRTGERHLHLEDLEWIRVLVVGLVAAKSRAGDAEVAAMIEAMKVEELFDQLKVLIAREASPLLGWEVRPEHVEDAEVQTELDDAVCVAGSKIAQCLDLPEDLQRSVLENSDPRPGAPPAVGSPDDVVGQVSRILSLLPPRLHAASSGGATAVRRALRAFEHLRRRHPRDPQQLAWLAMALVRLDQAENFSQLLGEVRRLGKTAVGERIAAKGRSKNGRIVDRVSYQPGLLRVIDEEGWEGSAAARCAAELVRELAGEEMLVPLREAARAAGRG